MPIGAVGSCVDGPGLLRALARGHHGNYIVITMRTRIIRIGNSRGIRIPKPILEATGLSDEVELEVADGELIVRAAHGPRQGWDGSFREMTERGDDRLLDAEAIETSGWDEDEWEW